MRTINAAGKKLIREFEGVRSKVYLDPVGLPTVGVGHLLTPAERRIWPVGTKLPGEVIDRLLDHDLLKAEAAVNSFVLVKLSDSEFAALVSFVFNIGTGAFRKSTLLKLLNQGKKQLAAEQFARWNRGGGKILPGLVRRRKAEKELFLTK